MADPERGPRIFGGLQAVADAFIERLLRQIIRASHFTELPVIDKRREEHNGEHPHLNHKPLIYASTLSAVGFCGIGVGLWYLRRGTNDRAIDRAILLGLFALLPGSALFGYGMNFLMMNFLIQWSLLKPVAVQESSMLLPL